MKFQDKFQSVTAERARELLAYDPETGILTWRTRRGRVPAGLATGCYDRDGYLDTKVDYKKYRNHRLAWLIYYGEWPRHQVDHIDGDRSNNRILNLRDISGLHNKQNQTKAHSDSEIGYIGVHRSRGKYKAAIRVDGKDVFLGRHDTPEEAHAAYIKAKRELHEGNTL